MACTYYRYLHQLRRHANPSVRTRAIYETGAEWNMAEGTSLSGSVTLFKWRRSGRRRHAGAYFR